MSYNHSAPNISHLLYRAEKEYFTGNLLGATSYGIVVILFFQCMGGLLNRTRRDIRWGFVIHTVATFSIATISAATNLNAQSVSYIDAREFPTGPLGFQTFAHSPALIIVPGFTFILNQWLADGLLLYRYWAIYGMNYCAIAVPSLMYLATLATGFTFVFSTASNDSPKWTNAAISNLGTIYFSISLSLNVLLTLMIIIRIALHMRAIIGHGLPRAVCMYETIITILVESCALYTVCFLLVVGPWALNSTLTNVFFPILVETQVIAPFLITLRVANRTARGSDDVVSSGMGFSDSNGTPDDTVSSVDEYGETLGERDVGVETTTDEGSTRWGLGDR